MIKALFIKFILGRKYLPIFLLLLFLTSCVPQVQKTGDFYQTTAVAQILVNNSVDLDQFNSLLVVPGRWLPMEEIGYFDEVILTKDLLKEIRTTEIGDALSEETARTYFNREKKFLYLREKFVKEYYAYSFQVDLVNPGNSEVLFSVKSSGRESHAALVNEFIRYISEHSDTFQAKSIQDL